jgi:putative ABC transport system permease protein
MFKLFLKTAIRNLLKDKFHSFLNITGLALGLVAFLYIATFTFHEISFDNFHSKANRIYRCVAFIKLGETAMNIPRSESPLAAAMKNDLPAVEASVRLYPNYNVNTLCNEKKFTEKEIWYADANVFEVFDFKLLEGDPKTALSSPNTILLTKYAAQKYFGNESPMGKSIFLGSDKDNYVVTGILDKVPDNSHLQFEMLASFSTLPISRKADEWGNFNNTSTYVVIKEGTNFKEFEKEFDISLRKYEEPVVQKYVGVSLTELESRGGFLKHKLQPLRDIHLNSTFSDETQTYGNLRFLIVLGITGILILIIACFNFVNLSTSRASLRAKEIGVKKIMGSTQKAIIYQILTESFLHCLIALIISVLFLLITLPLLNYYSETIIKPEFFLNPLTLITIVTIPLIIALLAGSYPAFYIAAFNPVEIVKGKNTAVNSKSLTRGALVTLQFVVFIVLVFCTIIIHKQINFLRQQNPGFAKENVLVVKSTFYLGSNRNSFKTELLKNPSVLSASYSSILPSTGGENSNPFSAKGSDKSFIMNHMEADNDFQKTLKVQLIDGRFFADNVNLESKNAIINEEAANLLGWSDCNEKYIHDNADGNDFKVIGIMKSFHIKSLREKTFPLVLKYNTSSDYLSLRLEPGNLSQVIKTVKRQWENFRSDEPFEYFFLDQAFDAQYKSEERLAKIIGLSTSIAILIACFGLFGLVSFAATQKRKEIGVRKVNGARVSEILAMLNKDFVKWVVIAFVIATPVAWYAMHKWLENFAYRTSLSWWIFALAGVMALGIALLTVSWQSWKAATRNPVEALRYE